MGIGELNIVDNLVYGIFGEPIWFGLILSMIFIYYAVKYDIPKWATISFFIPLGTWISFYYLPVPFIVLLILFVAILFGPRLFKAFRN